ncbi:MAG: hypothetical protein Q4C95_08215 [Planctomycetia bacterium]|nr:hypothetical protein [Planctomycetia bacterium]
MTKMRNVKPVMKVVMKVVTQPKSGTQTPSWRELKRKKSIDNPKDSCKTSIPAETLFCSNPIDHF